MQFKLPELGEGVHEGEFVAWKVKVGDAVKYDQSLCEIMTDKATVEIPSAFQGKVGQLHVKEGDIVHVGQLMLSFEGAESAKSDSASPIAHSQQDKDASQDQSQAPSPAKASATQSSQQQSSRETPAPEAPRSQPSQQTRQASSGAQSAVRVFAAPSTRRLAREMGLDLSQVQGSGPEGRVMRDDLRSAAQTSQGAAPAGKSATQSTAPSKKVTPSVPRGGEQRVAFRGLRKKIAEKMRLSKDKAAHFTYVEEADATQLVALRNEAKEVGASQGIKVTYIPFVLKAMAAALRQYPVLNSTLDEQKEELVYKGYYNIGISVQTDDGLVAPVIKDVGNKSILELARDIQEVVERARNRKLTLDDLQGGTVTLTNAGSIGGLFATPVINYPEVAILGLNKIFRKPVVRTVKGKEEIVIRDWTYFSISLDHRIVDGAIGAEFMKLFIRYIENPSLLLLESL